MNVGVNWRNIVGGEGNTVIMCGVDVVEDLKCSFHVARRWFICAR
jgi:hypothetical protein